MADDGTEIRDAAQAVAAIVEAVPVYQDAIQPAARQIGIALETVAKTVHIALAPISMLVWGYEEIRDFVNTRVAEKLANVPPERIKTPPPQVAGPTLEALRYTGHDETLREMYANLLATSLDAETAESAHPAFVDIIRSMLPDEGRILKLLSDDNARPVIEVRASMEGRGWVSALKNFSTVVYDAGCEHDLGPAYLENLVRLGLVEIPPGESLMQIERYEPLQNHPKLTRITKAIEASGRNVVFARGLVQLTSFGRQFRYACVLDHDAEPRRSAASPAE